jgi:hypothetical protein
MKPMWPKEIIALDTFLRGAGLTCKHWETFPESFGNIVVQYANASIAVQIVRDRGRWSVAIADVAGRPEEWYDPSILRDLLCGQGNDEVSLPEQIEILQANWPSIVECFGPVRRAESHTRLAMLEEQRARRRFPGFYGGARKRDGSDLS